MASRLYDLKSISGITSRSTNKMSNLRFREYYRRKLPHIQVAGSTYFITFRLLNSLPKVALEKLDKCTQGKNIFPVAESEHDKPHWFRTYDDFLDQALCGKAHLKNERVADMVAEAIHYRDNKVYSLDAFCIMPNHVHLVCKPLEKEKDGFHSLTEILHSLKRHSARQANLVLGRTGAFWQDESYDHIVRDQNELDRILTYLLSNPVKAGLVDDWTRWKWSYCKHEV